MATSSRRVKFRRADTCALCAGALAPGETAVWDPASRDTLCIGCDPGWSVPTQRITVVGADDDAEEPDYPAAGGTFWFSRKRFSGS